MGCGRQTIIIRAKLGVERPSGVPSGWIIIIFFFSELLLLQIFSRENYKKSNGRMVDES
jgi:hypothetical protein